MEHTRQDWRSNPRHSTDTHWPLTKAGKTTPSGHLPFLVHAFSLQLVHWVASGPLHVRHVGAQSWQTRSSSLYDPTGQARTQLPLYKKAFVPMESQLVHWSERGPLHVEHVLSHGTQVFVEGSGTWPSGQRVVHVPL